MNGVGYAYEHVEANVLAPPANRCNYPTTPLWQYYSGNLTDHFYSITRNDGGYGMMTYNFEKCAARVYAEQGPGMVPFSRYWNPNNTDHSYIAGRNDGGMAYYGYNYEKDEGYVYPGTSSEVGVPLYRYYNEAIGNHFYTTKRDDWGHGVFGYKFERIEAFVQGC